MRSGPWSAFMISSLPGSTLDLPVATVTHDASHVRLPTRHQMVVVRELSVVKPSVKILSWSVEPATLCPFAASTSYTISTACDTAGRSATIPSLLIKPEYSLPSVDFSSTSEVMLSFHDIWTESGSASHGFVDISALRLSYKHEKVVPKCPTTFGIIWSARFVGFIICLTSRWISKGQHLIMRVVAVPEYVIVGLSTLFSWKYPRLAG